jgi:hypothetical protein
VRRRKVPPQITTAQIAAATGWDTDTVRRKLRRAGILRRDGRRYVVGRKRLEDWDQEVYQDVFAYFEFGPESEPPPGP